LKDLSKLIVNMVSFENCKDITKGSFFEKVRTKPRKKFLTKAKAQLRFLKLYFLIFFLTKSISLMFTKTCLNPSIFDGKSCL